MLKTQANPGYLELVEINSFETEKIESLMKMFYLYKLNWNII